MSKLSVETEYDKAVEAVAVSITDCELRKRSGTCNEASCASCSIKSYQNNCLVNFVDVDKLRVHNRVTELMTAYPVPKDPSQCAQGKDAFLIKLDFQLKDILSNLWYAVSIIGGVILLIALVLFLIIKCSGADKMYCQSLRDYEYHRYALPGEDGYAGKYRKQILDTLDKTKVYITDINQDGFINCIDYTCTFKILWDKMYTASDCEIVRNKSSTMNHLFIRVRQYKGMPWECIEPQAGAYDITKYFMEDFWPLDVYNPVYNIYGETDKWLKEIKDGY